VNGRYLQCIIIFILDLLMSVFLILFMFHFNLSFIYLYSFICLTSLKSVLYCDVNDYSVSVVCTVACLFLFLDFFAYVSMSFAMCACMLHYCNMVL